MFTFFKQKSLVPSNEVHLQENANHGNDNHNHENSFMTRLEKPTEIQTALMGVNPNAHLPVFPTRDMEGRKLSSHKCLFRKGMLLDFYLFITEDKEFHYEQDGTDKLVSTSFLIPLLSFSQGSHSSLDLESE